MGYYIRSISRKELCPQWKIQFITQKKEFARESQAKIPRKEWDIPKGRWSSIGFSATMNIDEARTRAKQLNAQLELGRQEERRRKIETEVNNLNLKFAATLPEIFKIEFELKYIRSRYDDPQWEKRALTNSLTGGLRNDCSWRYPWSPPFGVTKRFAFTTTSMRSALASRISRKFFSLRTPGDTFLHENLDSLL